MTNILVYYRCKKYYICNICQKALDLSNPSNPNFFVLINPSIAVSDLLKKYDDYYKYVLNDRTHENDVYKDIYDGDKYRALINSLPEEKKKNYATCLFNTDGVEKYKSSKVSWPYYIIVNEVPLDKRFNEVITCGVWLHKKNQIWLKFLNHL